MDCRICRDGDTLVSWTGGEEEEEELVELDEWDGLLAELFGLDCP